jgi:hypothetical protein
MLHLNWQPIQNSPQATLFARSNNADSAVAVYRAEDCAGANTVSLMLRDWHVEMVGLPTSTETRGGIPGSAMHQPQADSRFHVRYRDRNEARGDT